MKLSRELSFSASGTFSLLSSFSKSRTAFSISSSQAFSALICSSEAACRSSHSCATFSFSVSEAMSALRSFSQLSTACCSFVTDGSSKNIKEQRVQSMVLNQWGIREFGKPARNFESDLNTYEASKWYLRFPEEEEEEDGARACCLLRLPG